MSLNPNAVPWSASNIPMSHQNQHDQHFAQQPFYPQHHMSHVMMPPHPHGPPRHGMMGQGNYPHQMHNPHHNAFQHQRSRGGQYNTNVITPPPTVTTPSYKKPNPVVILVFGYQKTGKTTLARRLADERNYRYISLKSKANEVQTPEMFVSELVDLLSRKNTLNGIVIDDALVHHKFEPYYVQTVLQKHGLRIDIAILLDTELENLKERDANFDEVPERQAHPERYEFCANYLQGEDIVVVDCRGKSPDDVFNDAMQQLLNINSSKETFLSLKEVSLMPKCPLERDATLASRILRDQFMSLNLSESALFPFSEPNYLLEYAFFTRHAYAFQSYLITPWIQGDKVNIIGYPNEIYIHLPSYNIVFQFLDAPTPLKQLAKEGTSPVEVSFILEATFSEEKLYISDLLMLGPLQGSSMIISERVDLLRAKLSELSDPSGVVQLLPWYPVDSVKTCVEENTKASGILFINPDGIAIGVHNSRNFLYPLPVKKSVELRIWNGSFNAGQWTFDAFCEEAGMEKPIVNVPVHISDADVSTHCINDGNILECIREDNHSGPNKSRKAGQKHFVFRSRCNWMLNPTTIFKQEVFSEEPKWPLERMEEACAAVKYRQAVRPADPKDTDG